MSVLTSANIYSNLGPTCRLDIQNENTFANPKEEIDCCIFFSERAGKHVASMSLISTSDC